MSKRDKLIDDIYADLYEGLSKRDKLIDDIYDDLYEGRYARAIRRIARLKKMKRNA